MPSHEASYLFGAMNVNTFVLRFAWSLHLTIFLTRLAKLLAYFFVFRRGSGYYERFMRMLLCFNFLFHFICLVLLLDWHNFLCIYLFSRLLLFVGGSSVRVEFRCLIPVTVPYIASCIALSYK